MPGLAAFYFTRTKRPVNHVIRSSLESLVCAWFLGVERLHLKAY
jgi:hypothetical protein